MNLADWAQLCDRVPPSVHPHELACTPALTEDERAALGLYAWSRYEPGHHRPSINPSR